MLVANREVHKVKRKREYIHIEVSKEKLKEYQKKISKSMNYERSYDNDETWEGNDQKEFGEELRRIEKTLDDKDGNEINIDRTK